MLFTLCKFNSGFEFKTSAAIPFKRTSARPAEHRSDGNDSVGQAWQIKIFVINIQLFSDSLLAVD